MIDICLAEFVSRYNKNGTTIKPKAKPNVIRFINFNKHFDIENHCREQLVLYVPFTINESKLKQNFTSWEHAYMYHGKTIQMNNTKFTHNTNSAWGDIEKVVNDL